MMANLLIFVSSAIALTGTLASASPVERRSTKSFQLWAYGPGPLGGFPVVYRDGFAYAVEPPLTTSNSGFVNITFIEGSTDSSTWTISPTTNSSAFNATLMLGVDESSTSNKPVGFSQNSYNSSWETSGWHLYGSTVLWEVDDDLESHFYATNTSNADGVWSLVWNADATNTNDFPVALRTTAPSTAV